MWKVSMVTTSFKRTILLCCLIAELIFVILVEFKKTVRSKKYYADFDMDKISGITDDPMKRSRNMSPLFKEPTTHLMNHTLTIDDCVNEFIRNYTDYCERAHPPIQRNTGKNESMNSENRVPLLCPCITLYLDREVHFEYEKQNESNEDYHPELHLGGHWRPTWCIPRQRIAIIVPYRRRPEHLRAFLMVIHPFLQRQLHYYTIFVIEQLTPWIFNKAMLLNVGFKEAASRDEFDCFIFHDVDLIPVNNLNYYGCYKTPRHVGVYVDRYKYKIPYPKLFGGATAFTRDQFKSINGYSNEFYGWGGEDDDMINRVLNANMSIIRFPYCVAMYTTLKHSRDRANPRRYNDVALHAKNMRPNVYKVNGLNSLQYEIVEQEAKILYTRIAVSIPDPPPPKFTTTTTAKTMTTKTTTTKTTTPPVKKKLINVPSKRLLRWSTKKVGKRRFTIYWKLRMHLDPTKKITVHRNNYRAVKRQITH